MSDPTEGVVQLVEGLKASHGLSEVAAWDVVGTVVEWVSAEVQSGRLASVGVE